MLMVVRLGPAYDVAGGTSFRAAYDTADWIAVFATSRPSAAQYARVQRTSATAVAATPTTATLTSTSRPCTGGTQRAALGIRRGGRGDNDESGGRRWDGGNGHGLLLGG